jgi:hypothetical protein
MHSSYDVLERRALPSLLHCQYEPLHQNELHKDPETPQSPKEAS